MVISGKRETEWIIEGSSLGQRIAVPADFVRKSAPGIAAIRFFRLSATYSVPVWSSKATPVGPMTNAFGSVRSGKPEAITVLSSNSGAPLSGMAQEQTHHRSAVHYAAFAATVPLSTLVTNSAANLPPSTAVMSHGPLM